MTAPVLFSVADPDRAALTGRTLDLRTEEPVVAARVALVDSDGEVIGSTTADGDGRFEFESVAPDSYRLRASSLGYEVVNTPEFTLTAGDSTEVIIWMDVDAVPLAPLEVVVGRLPEHRHPGQQGLYERANAGLGGSFVFRDEIEERSPTRVSDILATVGRCEVTPGQIFNQRLQCAPNVYLDGVRVPIAENPRGAGTTPEEASRSVNMISPWDIAGIEVFAGAATVPAQFAGPGAACGVILIWTRRG